MCGWRRAVWELVWVPVLVSVRVPVPVRVRVGMTTRLMVEQGKRRAGEEGARVAVVVETVVETDHSFARSLGAASVLCAESI